VILTELQRFVGSKFINWDIELYDPKTDQPAKANTSDLNEDLGQVEYLFSDKTGTLTENEMEFRQFSIDGIIYEEKNGLVYKVGSADSDDQLMSTEKFKKFFEILSLCHTVQVDNSAKEKYQASSPDEFSFIKYCIRLGIVYEGEVKTSSALIRTVNFRNRKMQYEVLDVFEFDSTRKRMSIILREMHTGKIVLYCKGAESHVFKKCTRGNVPACDDDIKRFAEQGWRTLALSFKYLSESDYKTIKEKLETAYNDILNRNENLAKMFDEVESDLELAGATAVEDKLQEDVADTLETLRRSGIKVWVLTGDKRETAINISYSCKHFSKDMVKLIITDVADAQGINNRLDYFEQQIKKEPKVQYALIIDGFTLGILFKNKFDQKFRDICMQCKAVLCCRMSPAQKAEVVKLVKKSKKKPMCAAIGDGANDVSMIQEAHVGLGIFGKEGRNAARSSDFAFAKFKYVRRILLAHGFLYYTRAANLVQYFFYKVSNLI
jgi:phospholipid-translocating ATPase